MFGYINMGRLLVFLPNNLVYYRWRRVLLLCIYAWTLAAVLNRESSSHTHCCRIIPSLATPTTTRTITLSAPHVLPLQLPPGGR